MTIGVGLGVQKLRTNVIIFNVLYDHLLLSSYLYCRWEVLLRDIIGPFSWDSVLEIGSSWSSGKNSSVFSGAFAEVLFGIRWLSTLWQIMQLLIVILTRSAEVAALDFD